MHSERFRSRALVIKKPRIVEDEKTKLSVLSLNLPSFFFFFVFLRLHCESVVSPQTNTTVILLCIHLSKTGKKKKKKKQCAKLGSKFWIFHYLKTVSVPVYVI